MGFRLSLQQTIHLVEKVVTDSFSDEPNPKGHADSVWSMVLEDLPYFPGTRCLYHDSPMGCLTPIELQVLQHIMASEPLGSVKREDSRISKYGRSILIT